MVQEMFERRAKGSKYVQGFSYLCIIIAVVLAIAGAYLEMNLLSSIIFYIIMAVVLYLLSTRFNENKWAWIFVAICGIVLIIGNLTLVRLILGIALIIAAIEMKKELD